ncbi:MAG TPA: phosphogluconate dehydratase [Rhizomicrobium sp.]|jgi:phosphogluconate dehydratase|nr:phosphogluconate dehydratase [Rhizomicrobium sp.]
MHPVVARVTARIRERSRGARDAYRARIDEAAEHGPARRQLDCGNLAHACAASGLDKRGIARGVGPNIGIVTAYNDMLSAHQPFAAYPDIIKDAARAMGATAQVAGGVPAMCDGVTQGQPGMELSLFSREVIALSTALALSHGVFDAALCLGVCDKIVPGLLIGALSFGHLPIVFVPAGPMPSGLANKEKARVREAFARGEVGRETLLESESASYHAAGTCTFYGTANTNQMLMEAMGLHLPGAAFVHPGTALREALTRAAAQIAPHAPRLADIIDERAIVNGMVALMATGGSTNHTLHIPAIARAAGILLEWEDFAELSHAVPLLARIYPNGAADVNVFHAAGGAGFLINALLDGKLLHRDVKTVMGTDLGAYAREPYFKAEALVWRDGPAASLDRDVLRDAADPFEPEGGLRLLTGNLGRAIMKVSAVAKSHRSVTAPAAVFDSQDMFLEAFKAGALDRDVIAVLRFQGPRANGMPELHKLIPPLGVLQGKGFKVALVTDGRLSGASGKIPAALHVTPEAADGGWLARLADGDVLHVDGEHGVLEAQVPHDVVMARAPATLDQSGEGCGRELFSRFRARVGRADEGACSLF